jgi:hypothetical protein
MKNELPDVVTDSDLSYLIQGTANKRHSLIKRALARGDLIKVRRGLYALGDLYRSKPIHTFCLAQQIYGPSYISFESALSYWGLIPEAVYTTTSGSSRRKCEFDTPFGRYAYVRTPYQPLYTQVIRKEDNENLFFIATPLRALADYVFGSRKMWTTHSLEKHLRLETFPKTNQDQFKQLKDFYRNKRVQNFLKDYDRRILS